MRRGICGTQQLLLLRFITLLVPLLHPLSACLCQREDYTTQSDKHRETYMETLTFSFRGIQPLTKRRCDITPRPTRTSRTDCCEMLRLVDKLYDASLEGLRFYASTLSAVRIGKLRTFVIISDISLACSSLSLSRIQLTPPSSALILTCP